MNEWSLKLHVPAWLRGEDLALDTPDGRRPNLSPTAARYLDALGLGVEDLFHHVLAVLHDPAYRAENAGALRMEWPRIPLPAWPDGDRDGAAEELAASAARGRELAALLDPDTPVPGVTEAPLRPDLAAIAEPATIDGRNMAGDDFALTAGWGHFGSGDAVMPGQGRLAERAAPAGADPVLGPTTFDVHLNDRPTGATSRPPSGGTSWAATRCSRSGSPTASATSSAARSRPRKCCTSPTPRAASRRCCGWSVRAERRNLTPCPPLHLDGGEGER